MFIDVRCFCHLCQIWQIPMSISMLFTFYINGKNYDFIIQEIPEQLDCNDWSQRHSLTYPNLAPKALKLLTVLATSVPSECLFSKVGETIAEKRNSLQGKRLSTLLFLQSVNKILWDLILSQLLQI